MTPLPMSPGDAVATKADIGDVRADIAKLEGRLDRFETRIDIRLDQMQRTYVATSWGP